MMKKKLFCILSAIIICSVCHADLVFKMDAPSTDLVIGGPAVTVTVSAWADDLAATGTNGLNGWGFSALVNQSGVAEVVDGSIVFLAPNPYSGDDTYAMSVNDAVTGGTGSIEDLQLVAQSLPQPSTTAVDDYAPIAQFDIQAAAGAVAGQSVTYTLGGITFEGILADYMNTFEVLPGQFDAAASQTVFTVVPEPATMVLLGLGGIVSLRRKK